MRQKKSIAARAHALMAKQAPSPRPVRSASDRGPTAIGRLVVETRAVDPTTGEPGAWVERVDRANLVVTQAETLMALMSIGAANSAFNYIELGDPLVATPPALGDLTLQSSTGTRKAVSGTTSGNVATLETTFLVGEGNGFTYTEAGLFTGPFAAGLMFARKTFAGIAKTVAFEMRFRWHITFLVQTSGGDCTGIGIIGPATITSYTYLVAVGGEKSAAVSFDFAVGANHLDVFIDGQRQSPGINYNEAGPPLTAPILGIALNKGVNFVGFVLLPGNEVLLVHRVLA